MKIPMRHPAHVPELREDPAAGLVHGIGHHFPAGHLLCRVDARGADIAHTLRADLCAFGNQETGRGALRVVDEQHRRHEKCREHAGRPFDTAERGLARAFTIRFFIRTGLERTLRATETMITGIDNAGVPDTPQGEQAANAVSGWADATRNDLEDAQDSLDEEADTLADAIAQLTDAARAITSAVTSGVKAVADVARTDPDLAAALRDSSTCQQLREETTS